MHCLQYEHERTSEDESIMTNIIIGTLLFLAVLGFIVYGLIRLSAGQEKPRSIVLDQESEEND